MERGSGTRRITGQVCEEVRARHAHPIPDASRMEDVRRALFVVLIGLLAAACGSSGGRGAPTTPVAAPTTAPTPAPSAPPAPTADDYGY